jgi:hypothetical protein
VRWRATSPWDPWVATGFIQLLSVPTANPWLPACRLDINSPLVSPTAFSTRRFVPCGGERNTSVAMYSCHMGLSEYTNRMSFPLVAKMSKQGGTA